MRTFRSVCAHGDDVNDLSEDDYYYLVHVLCSDGDYVDLSEVLQHMSHRLGPLPENILETLRLGFENDTFRASNGVGPWDVSSIHIEPKVSCVQMMELQSTFSAASCQCASHNALIVQGDGWVECLQEHLQEVSLGAEEWQQFSKSVKELAESKEKKAGSFSKFEQAIESSDHSIFLDAANIAFFNTMKFIGEGGKTCDERFQWPQVIKVYRLAVEAFPDSKVMVIVHNYRCREQFVRTPEAQEFLESLKVCIH